MSPAHTHTHTHTHMHEACLYLNESCLCVNASCHTCEWVMSTYERVMSHVWMSHVTHVIESRHTYEWVTSHIWISHVTQVNESCHTYEWVMSHVWMSHVTHMNASCHASSWVLSHIWTSATCIQIYTNEYSHIKVSTLVMPRSMQHHATQHRANIYMLHMLHVCNIYMLHMIFPNFSCTVIWYSRFSTGWRWLIGCLKLQVILGKRATNYRALLRKMTYEDKAPYDSTPSFRWCNTPFQHFGVLYYPNMCCFGWYNTIYML